IRNSYWQEIAFGDGFDVVPDKDDSRFGYAMSQQGFVSRYDHITGNNYTVRPTPPDAETKLRFNWNAGIGQDPFDNGTVYFGSQFVHKSTDKGLTWEVISPDLTTNDPEKLKQSESGGLTMDATGAENHCTILVIEPSPVEKDMLWVGTDDGRVHITQNGGANWTEVTQNIKGLPKGSWIPQIKASPRNPGEALLIANDYRRFNYTPYAYRTRDYGKSWERIVDASDVKSYTLSIVEDPENQNLLFLGTDDGLYVSFDSAGKWQKWTVGFPTVSTKDLTIHPRENDLVIGTFGRAAWVLDDIRPLRAVAADPGVLNSPIAVFDPPTAYQAAYQQPTGSRFGADALFNASNREDGAMITYYLKEGHKKGEKKSDPKEKTDKSGEEDDSEKTEITKDSIFVKIYKGQEQIRTLKYKTPKKAGFHRIYWNMDEKGPDRPSRTIRKRKREPGGVDVKPGTYRVVVSYGEEEDETMITVASDPRLNVSQPAIDEVYTASKKLEKFTQTAADAVEQLAQSKKIADGYQKDLKELDKEKFEEAIKASKEISKKIDSLIDIYVGKVDKRQGITRNPELTVMRRIGTAYQYVRSRKSGITPTENRLMEFAEADLKEALEKTNTFFKEEWKSYRESIEPLSISMFKETADINLE
ncbi:MAG: hypothetical protein KJO93_10370, partial [Muriicola sp.]|nr:hypothetical protein [Muriicola sp.]NNK36433.1 hypothetical protein [Eudoraea sp.]